MRRRILARRGPRWPLAWLLQWIVMALVGFLTALTASIHPALYAVALWGCTPLAGGATAFGAVRRGLLNYAAWIAPPICLYAAYRALWGYAPPAAAALICAFCSLVGAAAGEVYVQQHKNEQRRH